MFNLSTDRYFSSTLFFDYALCSPKQVFSNKAISKEMTGFKETVVTSIFQKKNLISLLFFNENTPQVSKK